MSIEIAKNAAVTVLKMSTAALPVTTRYEVASLINRLYSRNRLVERQLEIALATLDKLGRWENELQVEGMKQVARYAGRDIRAMQESEV